jgi:hypothetical protein
VRTVGIWVSGLLGAGLMGLLFGAMLDGPYRVTNAGLFWGATNAMLSGALWGAITRPVRLCLRPPLVGVGRVVTLLYRSTMRESGYAAFA